VQFFSLLAMRVSAELERERVVHERVAGHRRMAERLAAANDGLRTAAEEKRRFMAAVIHDLRQPLATMRTTLYLLRDAEDPMERDEGMDVLEGRVVALNGMIDELLQYAEIESGRMAWRIERVDLGRLLHHCLDGFGPVLTEKNLQLQREIAPDLGEAQLDPTKLTHVVGNLVANAIRFTPAGRVTVRARSSPPSRGNRWRLEVEDTGIGIAREELSRIFHEFYQVPIPDGATGGRGDGAKQQDLLSRTPCSPSASLRGVTTPSPARPVTSIPAGHGLGLAIVRHLCSAMGARVTVASEPGRGTRFALQLPRRMRLPKG